MNDFITALQFLTRIKIFKQTKWKEDAFSRSVPYFPLVGAVIGGILASLNIFMVDYFFDDILRSTILVVFEIFLTGTLFCDGLMDTSDGVFSGRPREKMLEIMKDSCVGANAVIAFFCVFGLKIAAYKAIDRDLLTLCLVAMPIFTRFLLTIFITRFRYARAQGVGGMFVSKNKAYTYIAFAFTLPFLIALNSKIIYLACLFSFCYAFISAKYLSVKLGGLTGDTYGFIAETTSTVFVLFVYVVSTVLWQ